MTVKNTNRFLLLKLPAAWLCGVRLTEITERSATASLKHRWINQNPFKSIYFAVMAMAAELTTGVLVMRAIRRKEESISMLVTGMQAEFIKKATGRVRFSCEDGKKLDDCLQQVVAQPGAGQEVVMRSTAVNADGEVLATFRFTWSLKCRK